MRGRRKKTRRVPVTVRLRTANNGVHVVHLLIPYGLADGARNGDPCSVANVANEIRQEVKKKGITLPRFREGRDQLEFI